MLNVRKLIFSFIRAFNLENVKYNIVSLIKICTKFNNFIANNRSTYNCSSKNY